MRETRGVRALSVVVAGFVAGCGGGPPLPTAPTPPPEAIKDLTFLLLPAQSREAPIASANDVVQSALVAAGYKITTDDKDNYDASISIRASATEEQGFVTVVKNGQRVRDFHVRLTVTVKEAGTIVDERVDEFDESDGQAQMGNGFAVVNDLTDSIRFREWARGHKAHPAPSATPAAGG